MHLYNQVFTHLNQMIEFIIALILATPISVQNCEQENLYGRYEVEEQRIFFCKHNIEKANMETKKYYLFHEIGHKFMRETITDQEQGDYRALFNSTREERAYWLDTYLNEYASFNANEDFAENFATILYVEIYGAQKPVLSKQAQKRYDYVKNLIEKYQ